MNGKSIAIAGFSTKTLDALKDSRVDEIWTLNHAFAMDYAFPRYDRIFELHKYGWFLRKGPHKLTKYYNWLRRKHDFPIYMQKVYKSFPASVRYPFEEVKREVFSHLLRGGEPNIYVTSSFGWMFGLAMLEGVSRIEIYGIDMTNETEWNYQKPAAELMIGFAIGRGVDVLLHPISDLCQAQLYGYDRVPAADRERALELLNKYDQLHADFKKAAELHAERWNKREDDSPAEYMTASAFSAMYRGGVKVLTDLLNGDEYYFGRQHLETERHNYFNREENALAMCNEAHAAYETHAKIDSDGNTGRAFQDYLKARWSMYGYSGARQTLQKLIHECDMRVVPDELRLEIKDA